jgi:hypothetical protein
MQVQVLLWGPSFGRVSRSYELPIIRNKEKRQQTNKPNQTKFMSTPQTSFGFAAATEEARLLPKYACLGFIEAVGEAKVTKSGTYIYQPFTIGATQAGVKSFAGLCYRPEWLRPGFDPESLKAEPNGNTLFLVYKMNIAGSNSLSALAGFAGSEENFGQLAANIQTAIADLDDADVMATVENVLREFTNETNQEIGYYSVQKKEKGADGKKVPVAGNREIGGWFYPGPESAKYQASEAAKGKLEVRYELD